MVVILDAGFESLANWTWEESGTAPDIYCHGQDSGWKTEGTYSVYLKTIYPDCIAHVTNAWGRYKQTINIPTGFKIVFDYKNDGSEFTGRICIDGVSVWDGYTYKGQIVTNIELDLSAYSGNGKVFSVDVYRYGTAISSWGGCNFDNIREGLFNVYVDINKSDDTGAGTSWATAKKTMNAGWDILASAGTMHVASGDYSAQATIAYNKSWKLSPEDPNSTGEKKVTIPKST